jgi:predicted ABC-type ATPase
MAGASSNAEDGPVIFVVGGPNGAGKSTSHLRLHNRFDVILDADEIARRSVTGSQEVRDVAAGKNIDRGFRGSNRRT